MTQVWGSGILFTRSLILGVACVLSMGLASSALANDAEGASEAVQRESAESVAKSPRIERKLGERAEIALREEWFWSSRRAGIESTDDYARLRREAVDATRLEIQRQQLRRSAGTERGQNVWVEKGPSPSTFGGWSFGNVSGRVTGLKADWVGGSLWLSTAAGGLWKSTDDGVSWTQMFDGGGTMTVGAVEIDPNDPDVIWAGTGDNVTSCEGYFGIGMMRSGDGGLNWEPRNGQGANTLDNLASFADVVVDPRDSNHLVAGGRVRQCIDGSSLAGGIYTTTDGGLNWFARLSNVSIYEIQQDPVVLDTFWAATAAGIYKSVNNGENWQLQTASGIPNGSVGRAELAIAPSDPDTVYAIFSSPTSIWRTTDGGVNWLQRTSGSNACDGQCSYNMVLRVDPFDANTLYRGTVRLYKSVNGGQNWSDLSNSWGSSQTVHQDMHVLLMDPNNQGHVYAGSDGGLWKSENGGSSFSNLNGNLNITQFYAVGVRADNPDIICGGAQDNSSLVRPGANNTWSLQAVTGDGFVCAFDPVDTDYAYITSYPSGGYPNVWRSNSGIFGGFSDITGSGSGIINGDRSNWVTPYAINPISPNTLYLGTQRVYRTDNRGNNWYQVGPNDMTGGSGSLKVVEINRNFPDVVYAGSASGRVWRTDDGGANWTDISAGLPGRSINDIAADPTNTERAIATVGGFNTAHVWEWNLGSGWTERPGNLPNVPANSALILSSEDVLVGMDTGIFRSFDGGVNFVPYMDGMPQGMVVTDLKYNPQQSVVTAGTYGRGAWQVSIAPVAPILLFDSVELPPVEVDGDGDDKVEPGETWAVNVRLRNGGGETATDVQARLTSSSPGVTFLSGNGSFGDISPGLAIASGAAFEFTVTPDTACGASLQFDLVDLSSSNDPIDYEDEVAIFDLEVVGDNLPGPINVIVDENIDPPTPSVWSQQGINPGIAPCAGLPYFDQWRIESKDAAHADSYHFGTGPGGAYARRSFGWLYHNGRDSLGGAGIDIPADAQDARLVINHWYDTAAGVDGAQVVIDAEQNGQDTYVPLEPNEGYPAGTIATGNCNGLEGMEAFHGNSGGWVTNTFNLMPYRGQRIYLAFVFGSDRNATTGEGWYVDDIMVEIQDLGDAVCEITSWPGSVANSLLLDRTAPSELVATWGDSCNLTPVPGQTYSIQAGSLDLLTSGAFDHSPVAGDCGRTSGSTFSAGTGNEYYLIVPVDSQGHQGGAGQKSDGSSRPMPDGTCGLVREATCP